MGKNREEGWTRRRTVGIAGRKLIWVRLIAESDPSL